MKKVLAVIMAIIMIFSSGGTVMAVEENNISNNAETVIWVFIEIVHSLLGSITARFDMKCSFCHSVHCSAEVIEPNSNCRLVVNGKDITDNRYVKMDEAKQQIYIPVIAVYEAMGADIKKIGSLVFISYNNGVVILDMSQFDFGVSLMPGTVAGMRKISAGDAIVESDTFNYYFIRNLKGAEYEVDYEDRIIYVNSV